MNYPHSAALTNGSNPGCWKNYLNDDDEFNEGDEEDKMEDFLTPLPQTKK